MKLSTSLFLPILAAAILSGAEPVSAQDVAPERAARAKAAAPQGQRAPDAAERRAFAGKKKAKGARQHKATFGRRDLQELITKKQRAVAAIKAEMRAAKAAGMSAEELQKIERRARTAKQAIAKARHRVSKGRKASPKRVETRKAKPALKGRVSAPPEARARKAAPPKAEIPVKPRKPRAPGGRR